MKRTAKMIGAAIAGYVVVAYVAGEWNPANFDALTRYAHAWLTVMAVVFVATTTRKSW